MSDKAVGSEENPWTQEDIEQFRESAKEGLVDSDDDGPDVTVHPGAVLVGIVLAIFAIYGAYIQQIEFTAFTLGLLTVLALGSKYINE
jgi:hypothetical protein